MCFRFEAPEVVQHSLIIFTKFDVPFTINDKSNGIFTATIRYFPLLYQDRWMDCISIRSDLTWPPVRVPPKCRPGYKESIIHTECCRIYPAHCPALIAVWSMCPIGDDIPHQSFMVCRSIAGTEVDVWSLPHNYTSKPLPSRKIIQPGTIYFLRQVLPHFASVRSFTKPDTHIYDIIIRKTNGRHPRNCSESRQVASSCRFPAHTHSSSQIWSVTGHTNIIIVSKTDVCFPKLRTVAVAFTVPSGKRRFSCHLSCGLYSQQSVSWTLAAFLPSNTYPKLLTANDTAEGVRCPAERFFFSKLMVSGGVVSLQPDVMATIIARIIILLYISNLLIRWSLLFYTIFFSGMVRCSIQYVICFQRW